jgi:raffinose/stachyose/melibiose transport system permease protein
MWNEFSFALVLTQSVSNRTLPLSIWEYQGQYSADIPMIMTVLMLSALPVILAFIVSQEKLIKGMMAGAVKG